MFRKTLVVIILSIISLSTQARDLKVESFSLLQNDISARINQSEDLNGDKCALIKISLPIEGCKFSGLVGNYEFDVNEYLVYVSPGTKQIKIKCPGFDTLEVDFSKYLHDEKIESLRTYRLIISDYDTLDIIQNPDGNMVVLDIYPKDNPDVIVKIDEKIQPIEDGKVSAFLWSGEHTFSVQCPGYSPYFDSFAVTKDKNTKLKVKLKSFESAAPSIKKSTDIYDDIYIFKEDDNQSINNKDVSDSSRISTFTKRFRGNVEIGGGLVLCKYSLNQRKEVDNSSPDIDFSFSYGYQIYPYLFLGAGIGVYLPTFWASEYHDIVNDNYPSSYYDTKNSSAAASKKECMSVYSLMIPLFVDLKFEYDIRSKVTPYADIKLGYQFGTAQNKDRIYIYNSDIYTIKPHNGLYFRPSIGLRVRVGDKYGISLGFACNASIKKKLYDISSDIDAYKNGIYSIIEGNAISINLGFDF